MHTAVLASNAINRFYNVRTRANCASSTPLPWGVLKISRLVSMQCADRSAATVITLLGLAPVSETLADIQDFKNTGKTERVKRPNTIWAGLRLTSWRGVLRISSRGKYWSDLSCEVRLSIFLTLFTAASALPLAYCCPGTKYCE